jgi:uncharacterized protein (TIGR03382 family)
MMAAMNRRIAPLVMTLSLLAVKPAVAAFHLMKIVEVFPGTVAAPNAQYVRLQMFTAGQNFVTNHKVIVFNAAGTAVGTFTFTATLPNGSNQASILIATTEAATLFKLTADLTMTAVIPLAGGKVCFDNIDCVAWGNYTGSPTGVGAPAMQALGLQQGRSLTRRLDIAGGATTLENADDTGVSANDFRIVVPTPKNNAGGTGTLPPSTCGNNTTEGLESCDDNNTASNDGCSSDCLVEACGDGIVQTSEGCDDTNTNDADACPNNCSAGSPGDPPPDSGSLDDAPPPGNDSGNPNNGDDQGGGGGCCQTGDAGAAPWLALLALSLLLRRRR